MVFYSTKKLFHDSFATSLILSLIFRNSLTKPALRLIYLSPTESPVSFKIRYFPYQLYPDASVIGEDKYAWYRTNRYGGSEAKMSAYVSIMTTEGQTCGIAFKFGGQIANTLPAHRVIQHFQEMNGEGVAGRIVDSLYRQYFEEERHPTTAETLVSACVEAGIDEGVARKFVEEGESGRDDSDIKMLIREQASNGVDSVPYIVLEGRKRDITLIGAKEVGQYVRALETIIKESK
jgi:predicted DsbA family dithiol-disulfide isomerase